MWNYMCIRWLINWSDSTKMHGATIRFILQSVKPYLHLESIAVLGYGNVTTESVTCWRQAVSRLGRSPFVFTSSIARSKRDGTRAETRFGLSAKRTSQFKLAGVSVQSNAGSRGVRISGQRLYRPCSDVQSKAAGYPLHSHLSLSLPLPCVTVCHQVPNALYFCYNWQFFSCKGGGGSQSKLWCVLV